MREKIKILFLSANPLTTPHLNIDQEVRQIREKLAIGSKSDLFELLINVPTDKKDLRQILLEHRPQIVHFSGHGISEQKIILKDSQDDTKSLVDAFRPLKDEV